MTGEPDPHGSVARLPDELLEVLVRTLAFEDLDRLAGVARRYRDHARICQQERVNGIPAPQYRRTLSLARRGYLRSVFVELRYPTPLSLRDPHFHLTQWPEIQRELDRQVGLIC